MAGHRARDDGAFSIENVPNGAGHGRCQIRLFSPHAFGMRAKVRHVVSHFPVDTRLVHDPVLRRHHIERNQFPTRYFVV